MPPAFPRHNFESEWPNLPEATEPSISRELP